MRLKNGPDNITKESISIGEFDKKLYFHYSVLNFKNISNIEDQGKIIDCYFKGIQFLLIPRNIIEHTEDDDHYDIYTSLLLLYTEIPIEKNNIVSTFDNMFRSETNVSAGGTFIYNNGKSSLRLSKTDHFSDMSDGHFSYLVTHQYENKKYKYRITSANSFYDTFLYLQNYRIKENTVLDYVFTGRDSNDYHNTYDFDNFKIKDFGIKGEEIFLSNTKGYIDLDKISPSNRKGNVNVLNFLLSWKNPYDRNCYNGMGISTYTFVPERVVKTDKAHITTPLDGKTKTPIIILAEDETVRNEMMKNWHSGNMVMNSIWLSSKISVKDILLDFDSSRIKEKKKHLISDRRNLINSIAMNQRELIDTEEKILVIENRIKKFIPFPEIVIPTNKPSGNTEMPYDLFSILKCVNDKYIIEEDKEGVL